MYTPRVPENQTNCLHSAHSLMEQKEILCPIPPHFFPRLWLFACSYQRLNNNFLCICSIYFQVLRENALRTVERVITWKARNARLVTPTALNVKAEAVNALCANQVASYRQGVCLSCFIEPRSTGFSVYSKKVHRNPDLIHSGCYFSVSIQFQPEIFPFVVCYQ